MLITTKPEASMALTMTSREIAELTGKDHKNVIRDIRLMLDELAGDGSDLSHALEDKDARGYRPAHHAFVRTRCRRHAPSQNAGGQRAEGAQKKAARCNNTLAAIKKINIHNKMNATNSIANRARPESAKAAFGANPCTAISPAPLPESQLHAKAKGTEGTRSTAFIHAGSRVPSADFSEGTEGTKRYYGQRKRRTTKAQFPSNAAKFLGRPGYPAAKCCATVIPGAKDTTKLAVSLPDSKVFSRQEFIGMGFPVSHGFGRDGANRKAARTTNFVSLTSRPPVARKEAASGFQSQLGAETMTTVNTTPTPKAASLGLAPATFPSSIARQQAIENALATALYFIRLPHTTTSLQAATGRAIRAASLLKQACSEATTSGRA